MNRIFRTISSAILFIFALATSNADVIGEWTLHLSYSNITEVCPQGQNSLYWVLASKHLYQYDARTNQAEYYSKQTGLSDNSIAHIAWSDKAQCLLIAYANLNIDMLYADGSIVNILDYKNSTTTGVKDITGALADGDYFYIKTSQQGIIKLNPKEMYIEDILVAGSAEYNRINSIPAQPLVVPDKLKEFTPVGPKYDDILYSTVSDGRLIMVRGGYVCCHPLGLKRYLLKNAPGIIQTFDLESGEWNMLFDSHEAEIENCRDNNLIAIDPIDSGHIAVGGRDGVFIFNDGELTAHYDHTNSLLVEQEELKGALVTGLSFDNKGNLYITNSIVKGKQIYCLSPDGEMTCPFDILQFNTSVNRPYFRGLESLHFDSNGYLWFVNNDYTYGEEICSIVLCCDPKSGKVIYHNSSNRNQNGTIITPDFITHCLLPSIDGNIWVGTSGGLVYTSIADPVFHQHIVPRNDGSGLGDYLLAGVDVYCMAEDKKGRLWIGTRENGAYLISKDRNTEIEHFTTDNSPLPDNSINSISIDQTSGKVFFCTELGIASYQSDATEGADNVQSMYCYPNPVRPEYSGDLTITGLVDGAEIIITDAMNQPVFRDTAIGGTMTWNMRVAGGDRLSPGIYFVHQIDNGSKGSMFKFLVL